MWYTMCFWTCRLESSRLHCRKALSPFWSHYSVSSQLFARLHPLLEIYWQQAASLNLSPKHEACTVSIFGSESNLNVRVGKMGKIGVKARWMLVKDFQIIWWWVRGKALLHEASSCFALAAPSRCITSSRLSIGSNVTSRGDRTLKVIAC